MEPHAVHKPNEDMAPVFPSHFLPDGTRWVAVIAPSITPPEDPQKGASRAAVNSDKERRTSALKNKEEATATHPSLEFFNLHIHCTFQLTPFTTP